MISDIQGAVAELRASVCKSVTLTVSSYLTTRINSDILGVNINVCSFHLASPIYGEVNDLELGPRVTRRVINHMYESHVLDVDPVKAKFAGVFVIVKLRVVEGVVDVVYAGGSSCI